MALLASFGGLGGLVTCVMQVPSTIEATPGAMTNLQAGAAMLREYLEPVMTASTFGGLAMVLGFGGAAALLAQPWLTRRFPRLAAWFPQLEEHERAPTFASRPTAGDAEGMAAQINRLESSLREEIDGISVLVSDLKKELKKDFSGVDRRVNILMAMANRNRQRTELKAIEEIMAQAEKMITETRELGTDNSHAKLLDIQNKLDTTAVKLTRLFNIDGLQRRMEEKMAEVNDEVRRGQIQEKDAFRLWLQRQSNLLDGEIADIHGWLAHREYEMNEWLRDWQNRKS
jgi:hypothetical protein